MKSRLVLAHVAWVVLAGGGAGLHLTASDADGPQRRQTEPSAEASVGESSPSTSMVLGRTTNGRGEVHELVLHAPGLQQARQQSQLFAVLSGSALSVTGAAVTGDWRFVVDPSASGDLAPMVVLKFTDGSVADLAGDPGKFAFPDLFNDDAVEASAKLSAIVDSVTSTAERSEGRLYQRLAAALTDPGWNGVLIFNPSVPSIPATVLGRPTGVPAGTGVTARVVAFPADAVATGSKAPGSFFALVDHTWTPDAPNLASHHLRALFVNNELASFQMDVD